MTFTAVVVSHANPEGLRAILSNLARQTRLPDEVLICHSGYEVERILKATVPHAFELNGGWVRFIQRPDMQDWGHDKRAAGLENASCDWIGFFNDDDSYADSYIEKMLEMAERCDAVYCAWNEQPNCDFALTHSTAGNFICRVKVGRAAGYTQRRYEADGDFIEALKDAGAVVGRVDDLLYFHNEQEAA